MFDIADLLPFLQSALSKKDGEKGQNPLGNLDLSSLISGGGFGGGQGGQGGLLGNLFKGGNSSGGLEGLFGKSGSGLAKGSTSGLFSNGLGMAKGATSGLFSKGALGLAKGSTGGLFSGGMSGAGGMGAAGIYSALGNIGGNMVAKNNTNKYGIIDKTSAKGAGALKGAGTGAAIGSIIPGVGTLIGAGVGALVGGLTGKGNEDEVKEAYRTPAIEILDGNIKKDTNESQFKNLLYDFDGSNTTGYAKNGGYINVPKSGNIPDYKVEDKEVIYAPEDNPPMTDGNGEAKKIGPNMFKFEGDTHSDSSGGIGVQGGNTPFEGSGGDIKETGFVFSNRLKTDSSKYLIGL